jgi:hypothetical protein
MYVHHIFVCVKIASTLRSPSVNILEHVHGRKYTGAECNVKYQPALLCLESLLLHSHIHSLPITQITTFQLSSFI